MNRPDALAAGPLARRDGEPVFDEAWQAQVMALAFSLMERGVFTNACWSDTLAGELKEAGKRNEPDNPGTYYRCALAALEALLASDGRVPRQDLAERTEAWRQAYLDTPHGQPVALSRGAIDDAADSAGPRQ